MEQAQKEAQEWMEKAELVSTYCEALAVKAQAVGMVYEANAQLEQATAKLGITIYKTNAALAPIRREWKSLPKEYRDRASTIRTLGVDWMV